MVNVAGPHSFVINRMAGVEDEMNVKTRALRHEVHHVPSPPDFDFEQDGYHTSDGDTGIYFRPESGNNILIGSEDPDCDPRVWVDEPDKFDRHVTEQQWEAQVFRLARRMPSLRIPNERKGIVDLYDVSDDWIPIYDRSVLDGFYMAIGTSGNQFKNAPVVGHLMAELIDRVEHGHDHDADPSRSAAPTTTRSCSTPASTRACARSTRTRASRSTAEGRDVNLRPALEAGLRQRLVAHRPRAAGLVAGPDDDAVALAEVQLDAARELADVELGARADVADGGVVAVDRHMDLLAEHALGEEEVGRDVLLERCRCRSACR